MSKILSSRIISGLVTTKIRLISSCSFSLILFLSFSLLSRAQSYKITNTPFDPDIYQANSEFPEPMVVTPFNGLVVKEIPIVLNPPGNIENIELYLNDPTAPAKCYRVYACMNDSLWELQAIYSIPVTDENLTLTSSTGKFYRHPVVNTLLGSNINPIFYSVFPEFAYDSWFTINATSNATGTSLNVVETGPGPGPSDPPLPFTTWNNTAGNLDINSVSSFAGSTIINITGTPTTTGMPDENGEILLGQFTSDGIITGTFNLQFRKMLNSGGTIYNPTTLITATASFSTEDALGANTPCPPPAIPCPGDLDGNGAVVVGDLLLFLAEFGLPCSGCVSDLNSDGQVNTSDLLLFTAFFGTSCE